MNGYSIRDLWTVVMVVCGLAFMWGIATGDTEPKQQEEAKLLCATMRDGSTSCVDQDAFDRVYGIGKYSKGNCPTYNDRASNGSLCGYRSAEYR